MGISGDIASFVRPAFFPGVELVSVCYERREFPMHSHAEYVIGTVLKGAENLRIDGRDHVVAVGDVLLIHPDQAHSNRTIGTKELRYIVLYLSPSVIASYLEHEAERTRLHFARPVSRDAKVSRAIVSAHAVMSDAATERLEQESALVSLIGALAAANPRRDSPIGNDRRSVQLARTWIDDNSHRSFGLADVASASGLSVYRLAHLFKDFVGLSPIAYRNQRRVAEARRMLIAGRSIAAAAHAVGFADQSHLTRQFQRIVGTSPRRYLRQ